MRHCLGEGAAKKYAKNWDDFIDAGLDREVDLPLGGWFPGPKEKAPKSNSGVGAC